MAENFIFGGLAAACSICIVNPIDVVKSRMQMQGELSKGGKKAYNGVASGIYRIFRTEGIRGLYRGLVPAILFQMSGNSVRFGVYYAGKKFTGADKKMDPTTNMMLALTAGGLAGLTCCPFFTLKTQFQVQTSAAENATGHQHQHKGFIDAVRNIVREQGVAGLYAGLPAFFIRCVVLVGAQMTTYDWVKHKILEKKLIEDGPWCHMASSSTAALAACVSMQPFDLIGARMMNQPHAPDGTPMLYKTPVDCFRKTIKAEGPAGLYKGVVANYFRMGPQYILTFMFFEQFMKWYKEAQGEPATTSK